MEKVPDVSFFDFEKAQQTLADSIKYFQTRIIFKLRYAYVSYLQNAYMPKKSYSLNKNHGYKITYTAE